MTAMDSFAALADPTRRKIVSLLAKGEQRAGDISNRFAMSAPAISQHLNVLRETGLIRVEKRGRQRIYRLDPAGLSEMDRWISHTKSVWNARLDALERALTEEN